ERDLEQRLDLTEPVRPYSAMGEVRPELRRKIGTGNNTQVDLVPEFGKDARRRVADPVSAGFVDPRLNADVLLDDARQLYQLFALEFKWQIAGIGVFVGFWFHKGRVIPGLEVGTDFAGTRAMKIADNLVGLRRAAHGIVEDICWSDLVSFEDPLHLQLRLD